MKHAILAGLFGAMLSAAPASAQQPAAEIHTFHCLHGCPMGAAETNDLIVREIYSLSSNDLTKFADWVAYQVRNDSMGGSAGDRAWKADPWLAAAETLEPADYNGAPAALKIDRGHQAPLASFSGTPHAADTNFLSNITPQKSDLNQGSWVRLENAERALARSGARPLVYVLTGPLYEGQAATAMPNADESHRIPTAYWKVIAIQSGNATKLSSFIFGQDSKKTDDHCDKRRPLEEIERRAVLRLFPRLSARNFQKLDADLGCP